VKKALTTIGKSMAPFPLESHLARIILASKEFGCTLDVLDIVSILAASSKLFVDSIDQREASTEARRKFRHPSGDHMTILNALRAYEEIAAVESKGGRREWCRQQFVNERTLREAGDIRTQLRTMCERMDIDWRTSRSDSEEPLLRCMVYGLVQHSAFLQPDGTYKQTMGQSVRFADSSFMPSLFKISTDNQNTSWLDALRQKGSSDCVRRAGSFCDIILPCA
jgi:HrpA-like RNA helicase